MPTYETGKQTYKESDAKGIAVTLSHTVVANQVAYVEGFLGVTEKSGDSGDSIGMSIDHAQYQFTVPSTLDVDKGNTVYIDITDLTGHVPDSTAYSTTPGSNKVALFKATSDKDANNVVTGILLAGLFAS